MTIEAVRRALDASGVRPLRISRVTLLGSGYSNDAYRVPAEDGGGDWCLRLPRHDSPRAAPNLAREVRLLRLLARHDLSTIIPTEAHVIRDSGTPLGTLHRMVEGAPLREAHVRRTPRLARAVAAFLSRLHAVPPDAARRAGVRELDLWRDIHAPHIEAAMPHLGAGTRSWLTALARDFVRRGGSERGPRVLIHGDISGAHLLVDAAGGLAGVIDFGDAMIADPALDFAGVLNDCSPAFLDTVLAHYEGPRDRDLARRINFYITVAPLFEVVYGEAFSPSERRQGGRRLAARAATATRRGG